MSDDNETPEERLRRFKEKADKLGPQAWRQSEAAPQPAPAPVEPSFRERVKAAGQQAIRKYVDFVSPEQKRTAMPESFKRLEAEYYKRSHPELEQQKQDLELQMLKEKIAAMKAAQQPATDLGDIDQPQGRQPVQMQREFSNEQEKAAYLERLRQAAKNAAGK